MAKWLLSFKDATNLSCILCSENGVCSYLPETPNKIMNNFPEVF